MRKKAQLSLEYLLLLAAVLCIFALLLPLLNNVFQLCLFGLDSVNAKRFSEEMQGTVARMSFQADGSAATIEANSLLPWKIASSGEKLLILVQGRDANKSFGVSFPNKLEAQGALVLGKKSFFLKKASGKILLEYD